MDHTIQELALQAGINSLSDVDRSEKEHEAACHMCGQLNVFLNNIKKKAKETGVAASFAKMEYQRNMHSMSPAEVANYYDRQNTALRVFNEYVNKYDMLVETYKWWVEYTKRIEGKMIGLLDGVYQSRPTPLADIDYLYDGEDISDIVNEIFF